MLELEYLDEAPHENCCKCGIETSSWHKKNDVALCRKCAAIYSDKQIPTKAEWLAQYDEKEIPRNYN